MGQQNSQQSPPQSYWSANNQYQDSSYNSGSNDDSYNQFQALNLYRETTENPEIEEEIPMRYA